MFPEQAQTPLEKMSTPKVKNQLKDTTHSACTHGAVGLPVTVAPLDGQTHLLVGSGVVGTPSGREGVGPCASSHKYQTLGMAGGRAKLLEEESSPPAYFFRGATLGLWFPVGRRPLCSCGGWWGRGWPGTVGHSSHGCSYVRASPVLLESRTLLSLRINRMPSGI
ncbi:unnamed protein product [Gulo gulo]|uniref:Uncharacterized protein n=1 Tax=Gulo gulo TaxID=48420 RepID=A0A9X9LBW6_GULGU|nr:unnamed protein product [Gulo gulo]